MSHTYIPSDLVLVTGANGHVAQHVVDQLLTLPEGPRVRATVRSEATATQIMEFYQSKSYADNRLQIIVVPDIVVTGAFDDAVKGTNNDMMSSSLQQLTVPWNRCYSYCVSEKHQTLKSAEGAERTILMKPHCIAANHRC